ALERPAAAELAPGLEAGARRAPALHRGDRPPGGGAEARRRGEARPVGVGQRAEDLHHLAVVVRLVLDAVDGGEIDLLVVSGGGGDEDQGGERTFHGPVVYQIAAPARRRYFARVISMIQFVSQVFPPSMEKACSQRAVSTPAVHRNRT